MQYWNLILGASEIALIYIDLYLSKNPPRTSGLSGMGWVLETLQTPGECHRQLRMSTEIFLDLHALLETGQRSRPKVPAVVAAGTVGTNGTGCNSSWYLWPWTDPVEDNWHRVEVQTGSNAAA